MESELPDPQDTPAPLWIKYAFGPGQVTPLTPQTRQQNTLPPQDKKVPAPPLRIISGTALSLQLLYATGMHTAPSSRPLATGVPKACSELQTPSSKIYTQQHTLGLLSSSPASPRLVDCWLPSSKDSRPHRPASPLQDTPPPRRSSRKGKPPARLGL